MHKYSFVIKFIQDANIVKMELSFFSIKIIFQQPLKIKKRDILRPIITKPDFSGKCGKISYFFYKTKKKYSEIRNVVYLYAENNIRLFY